MTLVNDFEFTIGALDVVRGDQFMFVQKLTNVTLGPLGDLNWKQVLLHKKSGASAVCV